MKNKRLLSFLALCITGILFFLPIYWLFVSSLKSNSEIAQFPPTLWPKQFVWSNFSTIWRELNLEVAFKNSIIVSISATVLIVLFSTMAGYAFSKKKFFGKNAMFIVLIGTMTVPPTVLLVPLFFIITKMGMYNTLTSLILPFSVTVFGIFFTKQYIDDVPNEILESCRMDGLGEFRMFFQIVLPLIKPALTTLTIITLVENWNSFTMPLVLLQSEDKFTLPLRLGILTQDAAVIPWSLILAANVLTILPIILLLIGLQRQFVGGIMSGAVKG